MLLHANALVVSVELEDVDIRLFDTATFFVIPVFCFFCFSSLCYVIEIFDFNVRYDKVRNVSTCAKTADGYRKLSISNVGLIINLNKKAVLPQGNRAMP